MAWEAYTIPLTEPLVGLEVLVLIFVGFGYHASGMRVILSSFVRIMLTIIEELGGSILIMETQRGKL